MLPSTVRGYNQSRKRFEAWLVANGSALLQPTNPYEVARFLTDEGTGVVYRNETNRLTSWQGGSGRAFQCFLLKAAWRARERTVRIDAKRRNLFTSLADRDGCGCMYCSIPLTLETATIEHVVAVTHGGPNHPANLALACGPCNMDAGHLSAREKLELAIMRRCDLQKGEK
jgi:hypothetical protein